MGIVPDAPLFRDPIYDGAADPVIIWNREEEAWWIFYTNRRAFGPNCSVSYMHGSDIGIASSADHGKTWTYRGTASGLEYEKGRNTYWAPEIVEDQGIYHMYVSYVRGIRTNWECPRKILHYTSRNLWDWQFESELKLSSDRVIDACVLELPDHTWKMWYKDEINNSWSYTATSKDLYQWEAGGPEITDCPHEGPNAFYFQDRYWMITDPWKGLGVYVSDDAASWKRCQNILYEAGTRTDDGAMGNHADVLVHK
ncbi:MAG: glycosyl hydrolase, partial [Clostridia bacterium]|nr:glycosyl hydrolase [Clostridia bacterium]